MSETVAVVVQNVRIHLWDVDDQNYAIDPDRMMLQLNAVIQKVAAEGGTTKTWSTGAVTVVANDYDYDLSSSYQYQNITEVRTQSNGWTLRRYTPEQIQQFRIGSNLAVGIPERYSLRENDSQIVTLELDPIPSRADLIDLMITTVPASVSADTDTVDFSTAMLRGIECLVAARCYAIMSPDDRTRLGLDDRFGIRMQKDGEDALASDANRISSLRRTSRLPLRAIPT